MSNSAQDKIVTETDALRMTINARNKSPHALSLITREVSIPAGRLEDFASGKIDLDVAELKALAKILRRFRCRA